jgi:hypothetical protein
MWSLVATGLERTDVMMSLSFISASPKVKYRRAGVSESFFKVVSSRILLMNRELMALHALSCVRHGKISKREVGHRGKVRGGGGRAQGGGLSTEQSTSVALVCND